MSGKKQHILPKFLLKGFANRIEGDSFYILVHRKDGKVFESNINNICAERYFYGKGSDLNADTDITEREGEYASLLNYLISIESETELHDSRVPEFITHMLVRTKHLRDSLRTSSEFLVDNLSEYLSNFENQKRLMLRNITSLQSQIESTLGTHNVTPFQREFLRVLLPRFVPFIMSQHKREIQIMCDLFFSHIKNNLPKFLKDAHIKALLKGNAPDLRVQRYQSLKWYICKVDNPVILGDLGVLIETEGDNRFISLDFQNDKIICVYLPICRNRLLVGTSLPKPPVLNSKDLNEVISKKSREFFVSAISSSEHKCLLPHIGKESDMVSQEEMEKIFDEIITEYGKE
jgi:hypothetical protein